MKSIQGWWRSHMARQEFRVRPRNHGSDFFSWGLTWLRHEQQWPSGYWLWCRAFPDGSVQSFPAIDRSAMTLQFWCSLFHCILSLLFLLRVLNIFTSMLYHCYAHKYILYMTLKCVHNILLSEKSGFPNWCMTYLTDSDFMSWCRNYEKGTMFWSCFVDDTHIHTQPQFPYL